MVGWRDFDLRLPNAGHTALVSLENMSKVGVSFEDSPAYHDQTSSNNEERYLFGNGQNDMTIITQNVDHLHQRAGSQQVTELHGRTSRLKCMHCGAYASRNDFAHQMETLNHEWLQDALAAKDEHEMRPDGDAQLANHQSYNDIVIPPCPNCGDGFYKPDVVFFGDSVPKHRAARCKAAVEASTGGLLCIGTSLAVHSAYRLVKLAVAEGIPVCVLNVGETRPEVEGLPVTKIEAPIGSTLAALVEKFAQEEQQGGVL
jgi:NAD-dependent deacetylase sirtuin 4